MQKLLLLWILTFLVISIPAHSQCPQPAFTIPDTVCINEPFDIINTSTDAVSYEWDFCSGDLESQPTLQTIATLTSAITPTDITHVFDGISWYGFVSSRDNHKIFRLDYGSSLDNMPAIVDLGNPSGLLSRPEQMKIIKDGSNWIGLVVNLNNYFNNFSIVKLDFGSSLTNIPTAIRLTSLDSHVQMPRGIEIISDGENKIVFIANAVSNVITIINFRNSLNNSIDENNIIKVALPEKGSGLNAMGVSIIKDCNQWYGLVSSFNNKIYKLTFGESLFSKPVIDKINVAESLRLSPVKVIISRSNGKYLGFIVHYNGDIITLNFGQDMLNNNPTILNKFGFIGDIVGAELTKADSKIFLFSVDSNSKDILRFTFPDICSVDYPVVLVRNPTDIYYRQGGKQKITLTAYDDNGNVNTKVDSVFVRSAITADFTVANVCEGSGTQFFSPASPTGNKIISWFWDFGDGTNSNVENPIYSFSSAGTKLVKLILTDVCNNTVVVTKDVTIYKPSLAGFVAPPEVCSYEEVLFQDASTVFDDNIVNWHWDFGNGDTLQTKNPAYNYKQPGNYTVTLTITGISGCAVKITKPISVKPGANVNFSLQNACLGNQTAFTDLTRFNDETNFASRHWNFGDGETSDLPNPVHQYQNEGSYTVTLSVENDRGCTVTHSKKVIISLLPEPAFSYSLACSGEATLFFDESTTPQGEITSWVWDFGDMLSETSNTSVSQNPSHIFTAAGTYTITLKVQTIYGCIDSISRTIQVISSPQSNFFYQVDCTNRQVNFSDQTVATDYPGNSWYWDFGDNSNSIDQNPTHMYSQPGIYTVTLITTASSRCTNSFSQTVQVSDAPVAGFSLPDVLCINNSLVFTDQSMAAANDAIISWEWDFSSFGTSTQQNPSVTFTSKEALTVPVTLKITTGANCQAIVTRNIFLQVPPTASFTYQAISNFAPLQLQFLSNTNGGTIKYSWDFGDGQSSEQKDPVHTYKQSGTYRVVLSVENAQGCRAMLVKEIIVSTVPDTFELKLEYIEAIPVNGVLQLTAYVHNNSPFTIQELDFVTVCNGQSRSHDKWEGTLQPGQGFTHTYTIPQNNIIAVCITVEDAIRRYTSNRQCTSLKNQFTILNPYPNPANKIVTLPIIMPAQDKVQIIVTDVVGKHIYSITTDLLHTGFNEILLGLEQIKPGMYLIQLNYAGNKVIKKIIVQ